MNAQVKPRRRRARRASAMQQIAQAEAQDEIKQAAGQYDSLSEHEKELRAAGLFAPLPEAQALREAPEDVAAKLTKLERDKVSLAEALARAAEIDANDDGTTNTGNKYEIDKSIIPAGWHYEWRRDTVLNERDPAYQVDLAKRGWRVVPLDRHPELMPADWKGGSYIIRGGMILMEIPKVIADKFKEKDRVAAGEAVAAKEQQMVGRSAQHPNSFARDGRATRDFGPILGAGETAQRGSIGLNPRVFRSA